MEIGPGDGWEGDRCVVRLKQAVERLETQNNLRNWLVNSPSGSAHHGAHFDSLSSNEETFIVLSHALYRI